MPVHSEDFIDLAAAAQELDNEFHTYGEGSIEQRKLILHAYFKVNPIASKGELLDYMKQQFPDITAGGHRGLIGRTWTDVDAPWQLKKTKACPKCGMTCNTLEDVLDNFGTRYKNKAFQSWCHACRSEQAKAGQRAKAKARAKAAARAAEEKAKKAEAKAKKAEEALAKAQAAEKRPAPSRQDQCVEVLKERRYSRPPSIFGYEDEMPLRSGQTLVVKTQTVTEYTLKEDDNA